MLIFHPNSPNQVLYGILVFIRILTTKKFGNVPYRGIPPTKTKRHAAYFDILARKKRRGQNFDPPIVAVAHIAKKTFFVKMLINVLKYHIKLSLVSLDEK